MEVVGVGGSAVLGFFGTPLERVSSHTYLEIGWYRDKGEAVVFAAFSVSRGRPSSRWQQRYVLTLESSTSDKRLCPGTLTNSWLSNSS